MVATSPRASWKLMLLPRVAAGKRPEASATMFAARLTCTVVGSGVVPTMEMLPGDLL